VTLRAVVDRVPLPAETIAGMAVAVLLQRVRPLPLPPLRPLGSLLLALGVGVVLTAWRERGPGSLESPPALVTTGLHGTSRNPMYVGFAAAHVGLAGLTRNGWMLLSWPASASLLHLEVLREETALAERFGEEYAAYRSRVPRYV
jgi:protein-S-isoprenylcysteine O-methyltransferase Ste14